MNDYKKDTNEFITETRWTFFSVFFKLVLPIVLFMAVLGFAWKSCGQPAAVVEKTIDADNMIYNYEYFKVAYEDIKALDQKILVAQDDLSTFKGEAGSRKEMDREDKIENSRLTTILSGLKAQRETQRAEYNARSKMSNRSFLKTKDLPEFIQ